MAEFSDRNLTCADCAGTFVFTAGEQQFYQDKGFTNEPRRCKACKAKRAAGPSRGGGSGRVETAATCSQCGCATTVPFQPTQGRPVLCRQCFKGPRANAVGAG